MMSLLFMLIDLGTFLVILKYVIISISYEFGCGFFEGSDFDSSGPLLFCARMLLMHWSQSDYVLDEKGHQSEPTRRRAR